MARRQGSIGGGLALMAVGAWFLADQMGYDLPGLHAVWPIFPTLGGLAFIAAYLTGRERDAGILIPGVGGFLVGLFFFTITLGPLRWSDLDAWWPVFPLIGGVAFLATWAGTRPRDHGLLIPAAGGTLVGIAGLLVTLAGLRLGLVWRAWPVVLIVVGLWILLTGLGAGGRGARSRRRREG